jgi:hypothetical protein
MYPNDDLWSENKPSGNPAYIDKALKTFITVAKTAKA